MSKTNESGYNEYAYSYEQRLPGYSGLCDDHWSRRDPTFTSRVALMQDMARLDAYISQQAERYPGEWIRNRTRPRVRQVVVQRGEWREMTNTELRRPVGEEL